MGDELDPTGAADPFLGRVLNGRIKIVSTIAKGGMGRVYYGEQIALSRPCAVKVLDKRLAGGEASEFNKRFLLEASIASKLAHPNVVRIFDYGEAEDGVVWLAMEHLDGKTLSRELEEHGRLEPGRAIHVAVQVARALREAHAIGVVHRDMKPGNVFLTRHDDEGDLVKVLDFGLVKVAAGGKADGDDGAHLTQVGQIMGSPKYMAPEQSQGHEVDGRADVYSLGATLFAMLTGRAPFERANAMATMMAHLSEPVPRLEAVVPGIQVPPGLEDILLRCMAKNRDQRYASMDELLAALKSYRGPGIPMNSGAGTSGAHTSGPSAIPGTNPSVSASHGMPAVVLPAASARRLPFLVLGLTVVLGVVGVLVIDKVFRASGPPPAASAEAIPAPSAPSAAAAPRAVPTVVLDVTTEPPGARVKEDGLEVCAATPCRITWRGDAADPQFEHLLAFLKADYKLEKKIVKSGDGAVTIKLTKAR